MAIVNVDVMVVVAEYYSHRQSGVLILLEIGELMRGGCMSFALHLHRKSRLPLFGLFDDVGCLHHAAVGLEGGDVMFDGRGAVDREDFAYWRNRPSAGTNLETVSPEEVRDTINEYGLPEYSRQAMDAYMRRTGKFIDMPIMKPAPSSRLKPVAVAPFPSI